MNIAEQELFCPPRCHIISDFGTAPFGASVPTAVKDRPSVHIHTVNRVSHLPHLLFVHPALRRWPVHNLNNKAG